VKFHEQIKKYLVAVVTEFLVAYDCSIDADYYYMEDNRLYYAVKINGIHRINSMRLAELKSATLKAGLTLEHYDYFVDTGGFYLTFEWVK
jgi:hypothetical protein